MRKFLAALRLCLGGVAITLAASSAALATPFLKVDVENNNSPVTAAGFASWPTLSTSGTVASSTRNFTGLSLSDVDDGAFSATISAWTTASGSIVAANTLGSRSRGAPTYVGVTDADMLRDFIFMGSTNNQGRTYMKLDFIGLTANRAYDIAVFSYENNGSGQATNWTTIAPPSTSLGYSGTPTFVAHTNLTNSAANAIPTTNNGGAAPVNVNNPSGGALFTLTTDGSGNATLYAWGGNGVDGNASSSGINPYFSGFTIATVVPEPATYVLLMIGGGLLLLRRKRS